MNLSVVKSIFTGAFILTLSMASYVSAQEIAKCVEIFSNPTPPRSAVGIVEGNSSSYSNDRSLSLMEQKFFLRKAVDDSKDISNSSYYLNIKESLAYFRSWLEGNIELKPIKRVSEYAPPEAAITVSPFQQMLQRVHEIATQGLSGDRYYYPSGKTSGKIENVDQKAYAQRFGGMIRGQNEPAIISTEINQEAIDILTSLQKWPEGSVNGTDYLIPIEGIKAGRGSYPKMIIFVAGRMRFVYPEFTYVRQYLQLMEEEMTFIKESLNKPLYDRSSILRSLARYYHLGLLAHPFLRVNNSILMMQVNAILLTLKMTPVFHGVHDYVIRHLNTSEAVSYMEKVFIEEQ